MPDNTTLPPPIGSQNPDAYPDYFDMQRKQLLAEMLLGNMQRSAQTPPDWNSMRVVPRRSIASNLSPLVSALMGGKALKESQLAQMRYMQAIGGQPQGTSTPGTPLQAASPAEDPTTQSVQPLIARQPGQSLAATVQASMPQSQSPDPRLMPQTPQEWQAYMMMGPQQYAKFYAFKLKSAEVQAETQAQLRSMGVDPESPQGQQLGRQIAIAKLHKAMSEPLRQGQGLYDQLNDQVKAFMPSVPEGTMPTFQGGLPTGVQPLEGATRAAADLREAQARGQAAGTPTIATGSSGVPIATFPAAPANIQPRQRTPFGLGGPQRPAPQSAAAPSSNNHIMSPTEAKANEKLAEQASENFQALNEKGTAAVSALRNLSEMKNLLQASTRAKPLAHWPPWGMLRSRWAWTHKAWRISPMSTPATSRRSRKTPRRWPHRW